MTVVDKVSPKHRNPCRKTKTAATNTASLVAALAKQATIRESSRNSSRICRLKKNGTLHSSRLSYDKDKRTINKILQNCVSTINGAYVKDDSKAPMANKAKSAFLSKPSFNIYFGVNKSKGHKKNSVIRTAYAVGTGTSSIGLDTTTMRIYPAFPDMLKLMEKATRLVKLHSAHWRTVMDGIDFNFCSVKIYYSYIDENVKLVRKTTEWHIDVELDKDGVPKQNNSQVTGTPVDIFTYGDPKNLWFQQFYDKNTPVPDTLIRFIQNNGSMFIHDGRDEEVIDGKTWYHRSDMINDGSVTFSFQCRVVQREVEVSTNTHRLVNPRVTPGKAQQHKEGRRKMRTKVYKEKSAAVLNSLGDCVSRHS